MVSNCVHTSSLNICHLSDLLVVSGFTVNLWLCLDSSPRLVADGRHLPARTPACQKKQMMVVLSRKGLCQNRTSFWWMSLLHQAQLSQELMTALKLSAVMLPHPLPRSTTPTHTDTLECAWDFTVSPFVNFLLVFLCSWARLFVHFCTGSKFWFVILRTTWRQLLNE